MSLKPVFLTCNGSVHLCTIFQFYRNRFMAKLHKKPENILSFHIRIHVIITQTLINHQESFCHPNIGQTQCILIYVCGLLYLLLLD